jgi:hypothetical protein
VLTSCLPGAEQLPGPYAHGNEGRAPRAVVEAGRAHAKARDRATAHRHRAAALQS